MSASLRKFSPSAARVPEEAPRRFPLDDPPRSGFSHGLHDAYRYSKSNFSSRGSTKRESSLRCENRVRFLPEIAIFRFQSVQNVLLRQQILEIDSIFARKFHSRSATDIEDRRPPRFIIENNPGVTSPTSLSNKNYSHDKRKFEKIVKTCTNCANCLLVCANFPKKPAQVPFGPDPVVTPYRHR